MTLPKIILRARSVFISFSWHICARAHVSAHVFNNDCRKNNNRKFTDVQAKVSGVMELFLSPSKIMMYGINNVTAVNMLEAAGKSVNATRNGHC